MKWPWISRKRFDGCVSDMIALNDALTSAGVDVHGDFGERLPLVGRVEILIRDRDERCEQVDELQQLCDEIDVALGPDCRWDSDSDGNTLTLTQRCRRLVERVHESAKYASGASDEREIALQKAYDAKARAAKNWGLYNAAFGERDEWRLYAEKLAAALRHALGQLKKVDSDALKPPCPRAPAPVSSEVSE